MVTLLLMRMSTLEPFTRISQGSRDESGMSPDSSMNQCSKHSLDDDVLVVHLTTSALKISRYVMLSSAKSYCKSLSTRNNSSLVLPLWKISINETYC